MSHRYHWRTCGEFVYIEDDDDESEYEIDLDTVNNIDKKIQVNIMEEKISN